jgi:hypothetical protein
MVIEQAILPATTDDAGRTRAFAWYNVLQDAGHALGSVAAGLPVGLQLLHVAPGAALRLSVLAYAALARASAGLYLRLSPTIEHAGSERLRVSPATRGVLTKLSALFALDALGGGFLTTSLLSYFFATRFGASAATIGGLFFLARVANALSHFGAAWLARRIGLVNTMVFTHIPSSLLLVTVAIAPSFAIAAALFVLRRALEPALEPDDALDRCLEPLEILRRRRGVDVVIISAEKEEHRHVERRNGIFERGAHRRRSRRTPRIGRAGRRARSRGLPRRTARVEHPCHRLRRRAAASGGRRSGRA